jgi:predicted Rossmann fold nucleotide-binding protein DprA/Smf involved in DNA uptake
VTATEDVLDELYGAGMRRAPPPAASHADPAEPRLRRVLAAAERHCFVSAIAEESGITVGDARAALGRLEAEGYLVRRDLGGWERTLGPILPDL